MPCLPILYSFRRCPYAIRARMALAAAGIAYEHREVLLKDKPPELIQASPKATVPVLVLPDDEQQLAGEKTAGKRVLDESLEIMRWALAQKDPHRWLANTPADRAAQEKWLNDFDAEFKPKLDAYKYADVKSAKGLQIQMAARVSCEETLRALDNKLQKSAALFGSGLGLADVGAFPFVRQYAGVDPERFRALPYSALHSWLDRWLGSDHFLSVMQKHERWQSDEHKNE